MLKYEWAKETQELWRLEEGLERDTVFADSLQVTLYSEYCAKEAVVGTGDFKIGEKVIRFVKYADGLAHWLRENRHYREWLIE